MGSDVNILSALAAEIGKINKWLLSRYDVDTNARDYRNYKPLVVATKAKALEVIKALLESGVKPVDEVDFNETPLLLQAAPVVS